MMIIAANNRTYDKNGHVRRAGCLIFKDKTHSEVLVISSNKGFLIAAAGGIEPDESISDAAIRESYEEAGVVGKLGPYLGSFICNNKNSLTHMYCMYVDNVLDEDDWPESKLRRRLWIDYQQLKNETHPISSNLRTYINKFEDVKTAYPHYFN